MKPLFKRIVCMVLALSLSFGMAPRVSAHQWNFDPNTFFNRDDEENTWEEIYQNREVILKYPSLFTELDDSDLKAVEVMHDQYSRTYLLEDGSFVKRIFDEPITYIDSKGDEQEIDNTLVNKGEQYTNKANHYDVVLPKEGRGITIESNGTTLEIIPVFGGLKDGVVLDNAIRYNNIVEGIDLQYTILGSGVKEDIILNKPVESNILEYELIAEGVTFEIKNNILYGYTDTKQEPIIRVSAPMMVDATGVISESITLSLTQEDDKTMLTVTPDIEWLKAPERAYPVKIDPTHQLTSDNLISAVVQSYPGTTSGPDHELYISYLYSGYEDGSLVATNGIVYGQSWSFIKINDITPFMQGMPDDAIITAKLKAWKYSGTASPERYVDAKMVAGNWSGDGRRTWNNRPQGDGLTDLANGQDVSGGKKWVEWDVSEAFKAWKRDPSSNKGIMLTPRNESQNAVCFSGTGNQHGGQSLYFELSWTVPNAVDEDMVLDTPIINLRPLTYKASNTQVVTGLFADGAVRPTFLVNYRLNNVDSGVYTSAQYGRVYPNSDLFIGTIPFTLGYYGLYQSNWQSKIFKNFDLNTLYNIYATATNGTESTPEGVSDSFIIYQFSEQDTLPYVANYYGVTRDQIVLDNRTGDDLVVPGNTIFIRNPQKNATIPYTRGQELTLEHKRAIIYANMGRSQTSEFDIEPVNMNTGNFWFESVDATNTEYIDMFQFMRTYNSIGPKKNSVFGQGWSFEYDQTITMRADGGITYNMGDGKQIIFPKQGNGWSSPTGHNLTITKIDHENSSQVKYLIKDADGKTWTFDNYGILRSIQDHHGFTTTIHYDANYTMNGVTTGSGRHYSFRSNVDGQIIEVTLPNNGILKYEYTNGYLTAFINADGDRVTYTYDSNGQMKEWFDGNGKRIIYNEYDLEGRVKKQIDAVGGESTLTYENNKTILKNAEDVITVYEYDNSYRTTKIDTDGNDILKSFDNDNQLTSLTDKAGKKTTYEYDSNGNITKEIRADGTYRQITYNSQNKPIIIRDFNGGITTNEYDAKGNVIKTIKPDQSIVEQTYDTYNRITSITDGQNNKTTFTYTGLDKMVMTDPKGYQTTYFYDAMG